MERMHPGKLIVLEGPDNTGKSTLMEALKERIEGVYFTHQPSGSEIGEQIYKLTQALPDDDLDPVARQYLHLASHAQHYVDRIIPALRTKSVIMDRCWISTLAYGYYGNSKVQRMISLEDFTKIARLPTKGIEPNLVFYCQHIYSPDQRNTPGVITGYDKLASLWGHMMVIVPPHLSPEDRANFVMEWLKKQRYFKGGKRATRIQG